MEAESLSQPAPSRQGVVAAIRFMDTAAVGRTQQEDREWGRDQQAIFDGVILWLAALTLFTVQPDRGGRQGAVPSRHGHKGDTGAMAGMATTGAGASVSSGTTVAASASATPSRWAREATPSTWTLR